MKNNMRGNLGETCSYCNKGTLIMYNGKYSDFVGCSRFPDCAGLGAPIKKEEEMPDTEFPMYEKQDTILGTVMESMKQNRKKYNFINRQ